MCLLKERPAHKRARRRFSPHDLAVLRICERNGWSIERDWFALSDREREEWLARDIWRQDRVRRHFDTVMRMEYPDAGSLIALLIAEL